VFIVVVYFIIDSVRKLLDTPSYVEHYAGPQNWMDSLVQHGDQGQAFVNMVMNLKVP